MADAQTPVEPPRAYAGRERAAWEHGFAAGLASQPGRAVMQQALDAIEQALNVLGTGTGSCTVCQCQGCAYERKEAVSILRAALSATMEVPNG